MSQKKALIIRHVPVEGVAGFRQAFRRGNNLLALQFHAEMGLDPRFDSWLAKWPDAVIDGGGDVEELRATHDALGPGAVSAGQAMIADWLQQLA